MVTTVAVPPESIVRYKQLAQRPGCRFVWRVGAGRTTKRTHGISPDDDTIKPFPGSHTVLSHTTTHQQQHPCLVPVGPREAGQSALLPDGDTARGESTRSGASSHMRERGGPSGQHTSTPSGQHTSTPHDPPIPVPSLAPRSPYTLTRRNCPQTPPAAPTEFQSRLLEPTCAQLPPPGPHLSSTTTSRKDLACRSHSRTWGPTQRQ